MNGERMYILEIKNISQGLVTVTCPAKAPLLLVNADNGRMPEKVALTSEQFLSMAYDLEGFIEGKHGVPKQLELYVTECESGRCEVVDFEVGRLVASQGASADAEALEAQTKQETKIAKQRARANKSAAPDPSNTLEGSVQAGLNGLK